MILNNKTFEKLFVWDESKELFISFYKTFKNNNFKDYFYKDQLFRATLSISNNIAE
jgi:four helix bundle protein